VLIVGCGYVGLPLGSRLAEAGHEVFGLRRSGAVGAGGERSRVQPLQGDITRPDTLAGLPRGYDWVVHCVSASGGGPAEYRAVYLDGTRNLLDWLSTAPPRRFVYTSSTSVYGQTDGSVVTETSPTEPATETGRILLATERLLLEAAGFPAVILRLAGIYGPGRGYWFKQYLSGEARIEGNGSRRLNMIHREDVIGAIMAALERGEPGGIYNVVDNEPVSQLELFEWLSKKLGRPLPPFAPENAERAAKRGTTNKDVSNSRLVGALGYGLRFPTFREGWEGTWSVER